MNGTNQNNNQPYENQPPQGQSYSHQPPPGQPYQGQPHQGQPYQGQPYQGQPHQGQPHQGQPHQGQPHQGQPHQGQPHQGQPHQGQPHQGQPHQGQPHQGQPPHGQTPGPNPWATPGPVYPPPGYAPVPQQMPFFAVRQDGEMARLSILIAFLFLRFGLFNGFSGFGVPILSAVWIFSLLWYAKATDRRPTAESLFWMGITGLTGLACSLWSGAPWGPLRALLVSFAALYSAASTFGLLITGKTGNLLFFDMLNTIFVVPFRNFGIMFKSFGGNRHRDGDAAGNNKNFWSILLGIVLSFIVLAIVLPLLATADSGVFALMVDGIVDWLRNIRFFREEELIKTVWQLVLCFPLALWVSGLVIGAARWQYHKTHPADYDRGLQSFRFMPKNSIIIVLAVASAVYALFIGCQIPYFFSALGGQVAQGYEVYSEYAREGFFELCRIAVINLGLLLVAGGLTRQGERPSAALKALNALLSTLTLLVIVTAFSKMALYIAVYGLTPKRVITCLFMVFLAGVCIAVVLLQFKKFSIVRVSLVLGVSLLCLFFTVDTGGLIVRYNANRYLNGSLKNFDEIVVRDCGPAGVDAAYQVYLSYDLIQDRDARLRLHYVLTDFAVDAKDTSGSMADTLANIRVRALPLPDQHDSDYQQGQSLFYNRVYDIDR